MRKKRFYPIVFVTLNLLGTSFSYSQSGASFFADFTLPGRANQGAVFSMTQDAEGNMEIATSNGVVVYDGANTLLVGTGADVDELDFVPELGKTYAACEGRIGFISRNAFGKYIFTRIPLTGMDFQSFQLVTHVGKDVYFQSDDYVLKVSNDKLVQKWNRPNEGNYTGLFVLSNTVFVNVATAGLYTLESNGKLKKHAVDDSRIAESFLYFSVTRGKGEVILGTEESELLLFTGSELKVLAVDKGNYLKEKVLLGGKRLDDNYMAVSTYSGGLMVLNMYNGIVSESYNTSTGFPDDNISCIAVDNSHGLWTSHEEGLTRIDRNIPVKFFGAYPGLSGTVKSVAESNGVLYAGCTDGLYWLKSAANAEEYEQALKQAEKINKSNLEAKKHAGSGTGSKKEDGEKEVEVKKETEIIQNQDPDNQSNKEEKTDKVESGLNNAKRKLKKLFERKKGSTGSGGEKSTQEANPRDGKALGKYTSSSVFKFASLGAEKGTQFVYVKIPGVNGRVKKLIASLKGLLCATNTGLYLYGTDGIKKIYEGEIRDITYAFNKIVFIGLSDINILADDGTVYSLNLKQSHKVLGSVYLENPTTMWLGETNKALRVEFTPTGAVTKESTVEVPAAFRDMVSVCKSGDIVYLVSSSGLFEYQPSSSTAIQSTKVQSDENEIFHYLINQATNTLFVQTTEGWCEVKPGNAFSPMGLLDVITGVKYITRSNTGSLWAVSADGGIYFLNKFSTASAAAGFNVFVRGVNGTNGNAFNLSDLSITHRESEVDIKWGSNFFIQSGGTWYSYKIDGWKSEWSPWTRQTSKTFALPSGNHKFRIKARDIYGHESPEKVLDFYIRPPFWETWWFYTLLALALGGVIWIVFRWRNKALIEKQKLLESMVKERTAELADEKEKTEELLLNILPVAVAQELKDVGHSSVRKHSDSAVMFTDFCDFTKLSKNMTAEELVLKLDRYFRKFDEIVDKYGIEKIKTIGDSYMCAAGVPQPKTQSSLSIVMAALEIVEIVEKDETNWKIRVGIQVGGLVSGVVGKRKFAYDIWGDTVNVASRMESSSEPMHINITEQVYDKIKDYFDCEKRGEVEAKSLGKTSMYFVRGLKHQYRQNGSPLEPSKAFLALLN